MDMIIIPVEKRQRNVYKPPKSTFFRFPVTLFPLTFRHWVISVYWVL